MLKQLFGLFGRPQAPEPTPPAEPAPDAADLPVSAPLEAKQTRVLIYKLDGRIIEKTAPYHHYTSSVEHAFLQQTRDDCGKFDNSSPINSFDFHECILLSHRYYIFHDGRIMEPTAQVATGNVRNDEGRQWRQKSNLHVICLFENGYYGTFGLDHGEVTFKGDAKDNEIEDFMRARGHLPPLPETPVNGARCYIEWISGKRERAVIEERFVKTTPYKVAKAVQVDDTSLMDLWRSRNHSAWALAGLKQFEYYVEIEGAFQKAVDVRLEQRSNGDPRAIATFPNGFKGAFVWGYARPHYHGEASPPGSE